MPYIEAWQRQAPLQVPSLPSAWLGHGCPLHPYTADVPAAHPVRLSNVLPPLGAVVEAEAQHHEHAGPELQERPQPGCSARMQRLIRLMVSHAQVREDLRMTAS